MPGATKTLVDKSSTFSTSTARVSLSCEWMRLELVTISASICAAIASHVELVNVGMPCESKPELGENDPSRRFLNLKASFYQALADAFEHDQIEGLTDETTIGQLAGILTEIDSRGRIKIESKEDARKRGVPSPDRAEALMLALGEPPPLYAFTPVRDFERPKLRGQAARDAFEDQMNDYRRLGLGSIRRGLKKGCAW